MINYSVFAQNNTVSHQYLEIVKDRIAKRIEFKGQLDKGEICPGFDQTCLEAEAHKLKLETSTELSMNIVILGNAFIQSGARMKECDKSCKAEIQIKMMSAMLILMKRTDPKNFWVFQSTPKNDVESKLLRGVEELYTYAVLRNLNQIIIEYGNKLDPALISDGSKEKLKSFYQDVHQLNKAEKFLDGEIAQMSETDLQNLVMAAKKRTQFNKEAAYLFEKEPGMLQELLSKIEAKKAQSIIKQ